MKKLLLFLALACSGVMNAYVIYFDNKTGSQLTGKVYIIGGKEIPISTRGIADTRGADCFISAIVYAAGKSYTIPAKKVLGVPVPTCGNLNFNVEIKAGRLVATQK